VSTNTPNFSPYFPPKRLNYEVTKIKIQLSNGTSTAEQERAQINSLKY